MLDLIDRLPKSEDDTHSPKLVCVDNYFTTYDLVDQCTERKVSIIGTFQLNRFGNTKPLTDLKAMKKNDRGTIETFMKEINGNTTALTAAWKDNGVVRVLSTYYGVEPVQKAKRWNKVEKREDMIPMPFAIQLYNKLLGVTDRQDQNILINIESQSGPRNGGGPFSHGVLMLKYRMRGCWCAKRNQNAHYLTFGVTLLGRISQCMEPDHTNLVSTNKEGT